MVSEIPLPWKSASGDGALAAFIGAEEGLVAVTMHGVGLTLMAEKTSCGGKPGVLTRLNLASIWLEMGVHKFAARGAV